MNRERNFQKPRDPDKTAEVRQEAPTVYRRQNAKQSEGGRRWFFLVADIVLLAAIVGAVLLLVALLTPFSLFGSSEATNCTLTYVVELSGVDKDTLAALKAGDTVIDGATGSVIGTIETIARRPYEVYSAKPSDKIDETLGSYVVVKDTYPEEFSTVTLTVVTTARYEEGVGYTAEDCRIAVGRSYDLVFPLCVGEGVILGFGIAP